MEKNNVKTRLSIPFIFGLLTLSLTWSVISIYLIAFSDEVVPEYIVTEIDREEQTFDLDGAVEFVIEMLKEVSGGSTEIAMQRLTALESAEYVTDVLSVEELRHIRFSGNIQHDPEVSIMATESLVALSYFILDINSDLDVMIPANTLNSFIDYEANTVILPVDLFVGLNTNFFFHLVFIDGNWHFMPYSLMSQINLSGSMLAN